MSALPMSDRCKPDSCGTNWFRCHLGTIGCPRIHDGLTPHCIACQTGQPCAFGHDPPGVEMSEAEYRERERAGTAGTLTAR